MKFFEHQSFKMKVMRSSSYIINFLIFIFCAGGLYMKKSTIIKIAVSLFIVTILSTSVIYFNHNYLYLPFTVPKPITEKQSFDYKWFKKPVSVEISTVESKGDNFIHSFYYPINKNQYETLARKYTDYYAQILSEGSKIPFDSILSGSVNLPSISSGKYYEINLRCIDIVMLRMELSDNSEIIHMGNDYYTITPTLTDEFINYIKSTYPIMESK
jgi:hypothetical protein